MTRVQEDHRRGMLRVVSSLINCEWDHVVSSLRPASAPSLPRNGF